MKNYLLSICIPTYNRKTLLKRALDSIVSQLDDRVELLVSDNASDDGTKEMIEQQYPAVNYSRNDYNIGGEANFLRCCELAKGKYFILFGSDDILIEGALQKILCFLENHQECSVVFMNHVFFEGEYIDLKHCSEKWQSTTEDVITKDKSVFMHYVKHQMSYMSCLIFSKEKYTYVQTPQQYFWTHFFHTNVAFEMINDSESAMGIIGDYCVADDVTAGNSTVEKESMSYFKIFGKGLEYTLCTHAVECGFDDKQMKNVYLDVSKSSFPRAIVKIKAYATYDWKGEYKEYLKPLLIKYPILYFYTIPFYLIPGWLARCIRNYIRPIYKKLKHTN